MQRPCLLWYESQLWLLPLPPEILKHHVLRQRGHDETEDLLEELPHKDPNFWIAAEAGIQNKSGRSICLEADQTGSTNGEQIHMLKSVWLRSANKF